MKTRHWIITDQWEWMLEGFPSRAEQPEAVGKWTKEARAHGGHVTFKLYDDEGNWCYTGRMTKELFDGEDDEPFAPLSWARSDVGAIELRYLDNATRQWKQL